ncbi:MAG: neutral zinc metallopeptidase [Novosphingobium sp.]
MRLDDFDPRSINVSDQRGGGFPVGMRGGSIGCGTLVIALIGALVFGIDPTQMLGGIDQTQQQTSAPAGNTGGASVAESCSVDAVSRETCNALSSLNKTWAQIFAKSSIAFVQPKLVFYSQMGRSGCGTAQSAMGPFYCPADQGIYIDTEFYNELDQRLGAKGNFARAYVVAHEFGHHVQKLTGLADQVRSAQEQNSSSANPLQVRMELQADCYAGVWAAHNKDRIEPGDIEEGLNAAHSIGDDTLMKSAGRRPVEAAFTHGSSAQRVEWLRKGLESGNEDDCDTFADLRK